MVLKTHLEPFREPLKIPPVGQPKNLFFLRVHEGVPANVFFRIVNLSS